MTELTEQSIDLGKCMHCKLPLKPRGVYQNYRGAYVIAGAGCPSCYHRRDLHPPIVVEHDPRGRKNDEKSS